MTCAACVRRVENALNSVTGVRDASERVNQTSVVTQTIAYEGDGVWREYAGGYQDWADYQIKRRAEEAALAAEKLARVLTNDPGMGVIRHVDAGYEIADRVAAERGVRVPMRET